MGDDQYINQYNQFKDLDFEGFKKLAQDPTLSRYEKIGFPDSYRKGYEAAIFADIVGKLNNLTMPNQLILDIGPGCSELPFKLIDLCREQGHKLLLIDSAEMLNMLPE